MLEGQKIISLFIFQRVGLCFKNGVRMPELGVKNMLENTY